MLGIEKQKVIKAIQRADIEILTDIDVDDLFYDIGRECAYNKEGKVVFTDTEDDTEHIIKYLKENEK